MPKLKLDTTLPTTIAAGARNMIELSTDASVRMCFGTTYVDADSVELAPGAPRIYTGTLAAGAFTFPAVPSTINPTISYATA